MPRPDAEEPAESKCAREVGRTDGAGRDEAGRIGADAGRRDGEALRETPPRALPREVEPRGTETLRLLDLLATATVLVSSLACGKRASLASSLAAVPQGTTLLNVDTSSVANSVDRDAWVADVSVNRIFPDTLEINVTEREIAAIVEVAADNAKVTQMWAIASDGMWLMEIPARDSELGATISPQIYEDADRVLHITGVPFGLTPEVGTYCADGNVNNALAILDGLSTELAEQVKTVTATDAASTCLTLDNGIEIAFGTAEDIRDKERIVLQIMADNPGKVSYINVRVPDRPTWRAV